MRASLLVTLVTAAGCAEAPVSAECIPVAWYEDADGDGLGGTNSVVACDSPPGWVRRPGDCDDDDPAALVASQQHVDADRDGLGGALTVRWCGVHPAAVGNGDDCDDGDGRVGGPTAWFPDGDRDGFGGPGEVVVGCSGPAGFGPDSSDCDDADPFVYPGAPPICGDGIDNDCDPAPEAESGCRFESEHVLTSSRHQWHGEHDGDGAGYALGTADVDGDGVSELLVTAPGVEVGGRLAILEADAKPGLVDAAATTTFGANGYVQLGVGASGVGDLDLDGREDVVVCGSRGAWLLTGLGPGSQLVDDVATAWFDFQTGAGTYAGAGDVDGDGAPDLAITAQDASFVGSVLIYGGPVSGELTIGDEHARIVDRATPQWLGYAVTNLGDLDGDGRDDLGVSDMDGRYSAGGVVFVVTAVSGGTHIAGEIAQAAFYGAYPGEAAGRSLPRAGDTDADGYDDLLVGAWTRNDPYTGESQPVAASLVLGPLEPGEHELATVAAARWSSSTIGGAGDAAAAGGDLDGDGCTDVALNGSLVQNSYGYWSTGLFFYYGPVSGALDVEADADARFVDESWTGAGDALQFVPDVDGDGTDELLVGAPEWDGYRGAAYLVLGGEVF